MEKKHWIAAVAVTAALVIFISRPKKHESAKPDDSEAPEISAPVGTSPVKASGDAAAVSGDLSAKRPVPSAAASRLNENVLRQFGEHMKSMNRCLGLSNPGGDSVPPTIDNLLANLRASLGDSVMQMEDYSQTEIIDKDSTRKRVRVDYDYVEGSNYNRRLSIYQINAYGAPEIVDLTADQSNNPNQAYVDSLIEGNQVVADERGARVYFSQGEEVVFSMKNGILQNLSVNRGERSFNCFSLGEDNSNCSCP